MILGETLEKKTCDTTSLCTALEYCIIGTNGTRKGMNRYMYLSLNKPVGQPIKSKIAYVVDPKAPSNIVGALGINFCPFCGTPFEDGWPKTVEVEPPTIFEHEALELAKKALPGIIEAGKIGINATKHYNDVDRGFCNGIEYVISMLENREPKFLSKNLKPKKIGRPVAAKEDETAKEMSQAELNALDAAREACAHSREIKNEN